MMTASITHASRAGGMVDPTCASRRQAINEQVTGHGLADSLPRVKYTAEEDSLWRSVILKLSKLHPMLACSTYLKAADRLTLPTTRVPSLCEVSAELQMFTGFRLRPATAVMPSTDFLGAFAAGYFHSTMYMRCPGEPFNTPDPDILHELVGHVVMLSDPQFAELYRRFGNAMSLARSREAIAAIATLFWFTMEVGVVREDDNIRAYGAALLSSSDELESMRKVRLKEFSIDEMVRQPFNISEPQPTLYVASSIDQLMMEITSFLDHCQAI